MGHSLLRRTIPELTSNGEVRRCVITLDPSLAFSTARGFAAAVRHEVGHCLGFVGHVPSGLMRAGCNQFNNSCSLLHGETTGAEWHLLAALAAQGQHTNGRGVEAIDRLRALPERRRVAIRGSDDGSQRSFSTGCPQPERASHGPS